MPRKKKETEKVVEFPGSTAPVSIDIPKVPVELVETSEVEEMSLADLNRRKAELKAKHEQVMLMVDSKKSEQVAKLVTLMGNTLDQMSAIIFSGEPDSKAYKNFSDAYDRLARNLNTLSRIDTNCNGEFTEIHLTIERR